MTTPEDYAARGWATIPIARVDSGGRPNKKPFIPDWPNYVSKPADFVGANLGIVTGARSGITVVDADGAAGVVTYEALGLPETYTVSTPSGGRHYYFNYVPGVGNKVRCIPGVDIRNDRGYVLAPPSAWARGTKAYVVVLDVPLANLSDADLAKVVPAPAHAPGAAAPRPEALAPGAAKDWLLTQAPLTRAGDGGQSALMSIVRTLVRQFYVFDLDEVVRLVCEAYNTRMTGVDGLEPWTEAEVDKKFRDVWQRALVGPDPMPFPLVPTLKNPKDILSPLVYYVTCPQDVHTILRQDPQTAHWRFNVRTRSLDLGDGGDRTLPSIVAEYLADRAKIKGPALNTAVSKNTVVGAEWRLEIMRTRSHDPVKEYLRGLAWDGVKRAENWLFELFNMPVPTEAEKLGWIKWLRSAVLRVMQPGCPVEGALVLVEEKGGVGKTGFFNHLFRTDLLTYNVSNPTHALDHPDVIRKAHRAWCFLFEEIGAAYKFKAIEELKAFLTAGEDTWRDYWQSDDRTAKRAGVCAGASNAKAIINDSAMSRRLFISDVTPGTAGHVVDFARMDRQRDQIWAEAMHWYHTTPAHLRQAGVCWGGDREVLLKHNEKYLYQGDEEAELLDLLEGKEGPLEVAVVKSVCPNLSVRTKVMHLHGWVQTRKVVNGKQTRAWVKK